jgi:hypothetical protein
VRASVYGLTLNTIQFTDNITYYVKKSFTMGTSTEINNMVSILTFNGRWQYSSVDNFFDRPNRVRGVYNTDNNDFDYNKNFG